ncbi:hypothetical protein SKAU_G00030600 [Synaphobranchus kaupii]|uniref:Uncharacterized protein n=1 Tax=Synaphobranchus kaupii TaxID=118154 RepID=A0A9Q1GE74_SYNKA|nr:hypothetical protein SKAU_G00030600 [Synaphobranchus kaupii]
MFSSSSCRAWSSSEWGGGLCSSSASALWLFSFGLLTIFLNFQNRVSWMPYLSFACILAVIASFCSGPGHKSLSLLVCQLGPRGLDAQPTCPLAEGVILTLVPLGNRSKEHEGQCQHDVTLALAEIRGGIPFILTGELFEQSYRPAAFMIAGPSTGSQTLLWGSCSLSSRKPCRPLLSWCSWQSVSWGAVFLYFILPETKNTNLHGDQPELRQDQQSLRLHP